MIEILLLAVAGILGGMASGLFGVGGGVIFVPFFILLKKMDPHVAIGTSLLIVVPTAVSGALKHFKVGLVDFRVAAIVVVFAILGAWLGAELSIRMESGLLRKMFALFLTLIAVKIFFTKG